MQIPGRTIIVCVVVLLVLQGCLLRFGCEANGGKTSSKEAEKNKPNVAAQQQRGKAPSASAVVVDGVDGEGKCVLGSCGGDVYSLIGEDDASWVCTRDGNLRTELFVILELFLLLLVASKLLAMRGEIVELRRQAEDIRQKDRFLASMSHEIRTPINGILGFATLLARTTALDGTQSNFVSQILVCCDALLSVVNSVLDLAKLSAAAGRKEEILEEQPVTMDQVVGASVSVVSVLASQKGVHLSYRIASMPSTILGDGGRLRQMVTNLLSNAVKFSEGRPVEVFVRRVNGQVGSLELLKELEEEEERLFMLQQQQQEMDELEEEEAAAAAAGGEEAERWERMEEEQEQREEEEEGDRQDRAATAATSTSNNNNNSGSNNSDEEGNHLHHRKLSPTHFSTSSSNSNNSDSSPASGRSSRFRMGGKRTGGGGGLHTTLEEDDDRQGSSGDGKNNNNENDDDEEEVVNVVEVLPVISPPPVAPSGILDFVEIEVDDDDEDEQKLQRQREQTNSDGENDNNNSPSNGGGGGGRARIRSRRTSGESPTVTVTVSGSLAAMISERVRSSSLGASSPMSAEGGGGGAAGAAATTTLLLSSSSSTAKSEANTVSARGDRENTTPSSALDSVQTGGHLQVAVGGNVQIIKCSMDRDEADDGKEKEVVDNNSNNNNNFLFSPTSSNMSSACSFCSSRPSNNTTTESDGCSVTTDNSGGETNSISTGNRGDASPNSPNRSHRHHHHHHHHRHHHHHHHQHHRQQQQQRQAQNDRDSSSAFNNDDLNEIIPLPGLRNNNNININNNNDNNNDNLSSNTTTPRTARTTITTPHPGTLSSLDTDDDNTTAASYDPGSVPVTPSRRSSGNSSNFSSNFTTIGDENGLNPMFRRSRSFRRKLSSSSLRRGRLSSAPSFLASLRSRNLFAKFSRTSKFASYLTIAVAFWLYCLQEMWIKSCRLAWWSFVLSKRFIARIRGKKIVGSNTGDDGQQESALDKIRRDLEEERQQRQKRWRNTPKGFVDVEVAVRDHGIGVALDKIGSLFKEFHQADVTHRRRFGGTGLGLAIVARLAGLMGGEAWVDSIEGEGSAFFFIVRLRSPEADTSDSEHNSATTVAAAAGEEKETPAPSPVVNLVAPTTTAAAVAAPRSRSNSISEAEKREEKEKVAEVQSKEISSSTTAASASAGAVFVGSHEEEENSHSPRERRTSSASASLVVDVSPKPASRRQSRSSSNSPSIRPTICLDEFENQELQKQQQQQQQMEQEQESAAAATAATCLPVTVTSGGKVLSQHHRALSDLLATPPNSVGSKTSTPSPHFPSVSHSNNSSPRPWPEVAVSSSSGNQPQQVQAQQQQQFQQQQQQQEQGQQQQQLASVSENLVVLSGPSSRRNSGASSGASSGNPFDGPLSSKSAALARLVRGSSASSGSGGGSFSSAGPTPRSPDVLGMDRDFLQSCNSSVSSHGNAMDDLIAMRGALARSMSVGSTGSIESDGNIYLGGSVGSSGNNNIITNNNNNNNSNHSSGKSSRLSAMNLHVQTFATSASAAQRIGGSGSGSPQHGLGGTGSPSSTAASSPVASSSLLMALGGMISANSTMTTTSSSVAAGGSSTTTSAFGNRRRSQLLDPRGSEDDMLSGGGGGASTSSAAAATAAANFSSEVAERDVKLHSSIRILVADDDSMSTMVASALLNDIGYTHVTSVASGEEAVELCAKAAVRHCDFHIVLMDISFPGGIDGVEASNQIQTKCKSFSRTPPAIIPMTALAAAEDIRRAGNAGMTGYLLKPFTVRQLSDLIALVLDALDVDSIVSAEAAAAAALVEGLVSGGLTSDDSENKSWDDILYGPEEEEEEEKAKRQQQQKKRRERRMQDRQSSVLQIDDSAAPDPNDNDDAASVSSSVSSASAGSAVSSSSSSSSSSEGEGGERKKKEEGEDDVSSAAAAAAAAVRKERTREFLNQQRSRSSLADVEEKESVESRSSHSRSPTFPAPSCISPRSLAMQRAQSESVLSTSVAFQQEDDHSHHPQLPVVMRHSNSIAVCIPSPSSTSDSPPSSSSVRSMMKTMPRSSRVVAVAGSGPTTPTTIARNAASARGGSGAAVGGVAGATSSTVIIPIGEDTNSSANINKERLRQLENAAVPPTAVVPLRPDASRALAAANAAFAHSSVGGGSAAAAAATPSSSSLLSGNVPSAFAKRPTTMKPCVIRLPSFREKLVRRASSMSLSAATTAPPSPFSMSGGSFSLPNPTSNKSPSPRPALSPVPSSTTSTNSAQSFPNSGNSSSGESQSGNLSSTTPSRSPGAATSVNEMSRSQLSKHAIDAVLAKPININGLQEVIQESQAKRVLVVDDVSINVTIAIHMVRAQCGVSDCVGASGGREAVAKIIEAAKNGNPFDLVLMDMQMPDVDGRQAAKMLHDEMGDAAPFVVALTAEVSNDELAWM